MALHFTIYKFNPATGKKTALHEKVPEQIVDWLCELCERELCERELSPRDEAKGFVILKESHVRPIERFVGAQKQSTQGGVSSQFGSLPLAG